MNRFKDLFTNRLFVGALVFFILTVGGTLLYLQHIKQQTADESIHPEVSIKTLTSKQPTTAEGPVNETSHGGHVHKDVTWHAAEAPGDTSQGGDMLTGDAAWTPTKTGKPQIEEQNAELLASQKASMAKRAAYEEAHANYKQALLQYFETHKKWQEKHRKAFTERMKESRAFVDLSIPGSTPEDIAEYFNSLSDAERKQRNAKIKVQDERLKAADKKLDAVQQEEPVRPTPPQND